MRLSSYTTLLFIFLFLSCNNPKTSIKIEPIKASVKEMPYFTYQKENLFPGDGSLLRAEDGLSLEDGRIIVVDQAHGLRLIEKDGSNRPFGNFKEAGFVHLPPEKIAAPNGVVLEPDGKHILMSDVADGKIYRVTIATEEVEMIYDHPYGVNTIYRDKTGALWFSQSAKSTNVKEMFAAANLPVPTGAVFRMASLKSEPTVIVDSLYFANGITMDQEEKKLYVSETMMDRVLVFEVNTQNGATKYEGIAASVGSPDNILIDDTGRLVIASPLFNQVVSVDFKQHSQKIIFDGSTAANSKMSNEWVRRSHLGMERLEILSPDLFHPLPGLLTGMFFSNDGKTLYISNLGNDLLKYDYP